MLTYVSRVRPLDAVQSAVTLDFGVVLIAGSVLVQNIEELGGTRESKREENAGNKSSYECKVGFRFHCTASMHPPTDSNQHRKPPKRAGSPPFFGGLCQLDGDSHTGRFLLAALAAVSLATDRPTFARGWDDPSAGRPLMQVFRSEKMTGTNTQIVRDRNGRLYVGNDHLLEFDGREWKSIAVGDGYLPLSLEVDDMNRVWVGAMNEVGYLEDTPDGTRVYRSLTKHIPEKYTLGDVWAVYHVRGKTLFVAEDLVLVWNGEQFEIVEMPNGFRLFAVPFREGVLISQRDEAVWYWDGNTFSSLDVGGHETESITFAANTGNGTYLVDPGLNFGLLSENGFKPVETDSRAVLERARRVMALTLPDGKICVATFLQGLVFLDPQGNFIRQIDRSSGFPSVNCIDLFLDDSGGLWVSTTSAVVRMDAKNVGSLFDNLNGIDSPPVYQIVSDRAGTFALTLETASTLVSAPNRFSPASFKPVEGFRDAYYDILPTKNDGVLFSGSHHIQALKGGTTSNVITGPDAFFAMLPLEGEMSIVSEGRNVLILEHGGGSVKRGATLMSNLPEPEPDLALDSNNILWAATPRNGIFSTLVSEGGGNPVHQLLPSSRFTTASVDPRTFVLGGRAYAYNHEEVFRLESIGEPTAQLQLQGFGLLAAERVGESDIWAIAQRGRESTMLVRLTERNGEVRMAPFRSEHLGAIGTPKTIARNKANRELWIGGSQGVTRIDLTLLDEAPVNVAPVILGARWRTPEETRHLVARSPGELPFNGDANLHFEIRHGGDILSRPYVIETRLAGLERAWTTTDGERSFSGLREGNYTLEVRELDFHGNPGPVSQFPVTIAPPWHRSTWAYAGYVGIAAVLIWLAVALRTRRVAKLNVQLEKLISARTQELTRAAAQRSAFLANMGHEIRNPLNGVVGLVESLRDEALNDRAQGILGRLGRCADQLVAVVEDVLEFSKVDAGKITVRMKPFEVREPVNEAVDIFSAAAPDCPISIEAPKPLMAERVVGDAGRIRQILINYLANALKFAGNSEITLGVARRQDALVYSVADHGPGIPKEEQDRLFVRFSRGRAAHKDKIPGTGLGLAACKAYADAMGANVWVESEPGTGATFCLSIPFKRATEEDDTPTVIAPDIMIGRSALVVDDHEFNRDIMTDLLGRMGATATSAADIASAREEYARVVPDYVFVDFDLSGQTGAELAEWIRSEAPIGRDVPIVATTAFEVDEVRRRCEEAGMDGFLAKPVTEQKVAHVVSRIEAIRAGDAPCQLWGGETQSPHASPIEILAGGDETKRLELLASTWQVVIDESQGAKTCVEGGRLPEASTHAHRLVSAALTLELDEIVTIARELNEATKSGKRKKAAKLSRSLTEAVDASQRQRIG